MKTGENQRSTFSAQACIFVLALAMMAGIVLLWPTRATLAQQSDIRTDVVEAVPLKEQQVSKKEGQIEIQSPDALAPDLITVTTYPFTSASGVALEDMSSGTTQLVAANLDDTASVVTNIGFDFWYDGVRATQFSVNANGLCRLGATAVGTTFTNNLASTTNSPQIAPYWDDLWTGTNGKVHFKVIGSAPNRKLIVEWLNEQIPRVGAGNAGAGTFQMWLFETTGVIEFVYGSGVAVNAANGGYSIGLQSGAATNFASVTSTGPTVSYAAANNTQTNAIASGTAYIFTPNVPAAPTGLSFTGITATGMTLNWTDNATNEFGYVIYQSTDGINYSFAVQTAANATSQGVSGLNPSTTYFFKVFAVTEGALSSSLDGSQATTPAGVVTSTVVGGPWSVPATWVGGVVPTSNDDVTIVDGATVIIDTAAVALDVTVGQGTSGVLQFDTTAARTLTVGINVTVASGGTFNTGAVGAITTHVLSLGGNLTNNGTLDFSTNADTAGAGITFPAGATNQTFGGTGSVTDVRTITVAKGAQATVVELNPTNFTVRGVNTDVAGYLTLTSGTFKISGTFTMANRTFPGPTYVIPALGGIWLNNPNYTVAGTASSTTSGNSGLLRLTQGIYTIGLAAGDGFQAGLAGGSYIIEGGTLNANGRFDPQAVTTYTQSAGTVNVAVVGNSVSAFGSFEIFATASTFNMSGGTINLINPATGATKDDYVMRAQTQSITGGQVVFGATGAPAASSYGVPFGTTFLPNFTVNPTMTLNINNVAVFFRGTSVTNNGAIISTGASARFDFANTGAAMSYSGAGTLGTLAAPFAGVGISANSTFLTTLSSPIVCNRVNLFQGGFVNSNQITLGNAGASTTVVQTGSAGLTTPGGSFDVSPVHNQGTGGQILLYLFETAPRTTGVEMNPTRILTSMTVDNPNNLTIAGGDLTLSNTAVAATMTNGRIITGANTLILSSGTATVTRTNGYVDGNFRKTYTAIGSKTFEVGTANAFSPATMNVTTLTINPSTLTVRANQGPQPVLSPTTSLQRYWTVTEGGDVTATMTFTYATDALDVMGTEANYRVIRVTGGTAVNFVEVCPAGPCVAEATNTITIPGVTEFSDWTAGEPLAPTAAPAFISGQVTTASGVPLAGVTMFLSGARAARAITDSNGNYRFMNVDTDNFYTVTPSIVNYQFSPASRSFSLLANKTDATFTGTRNAVVTGNVIDTPEFFVRQHYLDFLGREPDDGGLMFWSDQLLGCGNDFNCLERRTINVSAAYFLSIEFRETGGLVDSLYHASYGRAPVFNEFMPDTATVARNVIVNQTGWQEQLRTNKQQFLDAWVQRAAFRAAYDNLGNDSYVDTLIGNTGVEFTAAERGVLVSGLNSNTLTRAEVLQQVAQNERFVKARFNEAFVRMQYFGYLRRDPDDSGFHFWLNKLNEFEGNFERAEMVKAFLVSGEYRDRFRQ